MATLAGLLQEAGVLTSLVVSMAGKELSKPLISWPPTLAWLKSPPSRSSSPSSTVAARSFSEANWSASSPRRARSRSRKLLASLESPPISKSAASPRASVWPARVSMGCGAASGVQWLSSPASISSNEGNRSAIVIVEDVGDVVRGRRRGQTGDSSLRTSGLLLRQAQVPSVTARELLGAAEPRLAASALSVSSSPSLRPRSSLHIANPRHHCSRELSQSAYRILKASSPLLPSRILLQVDCQIARVRTISSSCSFHS
jgi:hypothetical protein